MKDETTYGPRELHPAEIKLLETKTRKELAEARLAEIELAVMRDKERDRTVQPGKIRHLYVNDSISGRSVDMWIDALQHWERRDPGQPIEITINSPGGSVLDGLALFDVILRLRRKGHPVTTRGTGLIASMATILLQAGDERILDANSWFMIHEVSSGARGTVSEIEEQQAFTKRLNDRLMDILLERSTLTKRQIQARTKKRDEWLSAEEAVKLGFADRVE
ncbi:MAG: Clp protease ClpP [Dehalococcoidia bacterium]|nr:Clp protease ClpP [Dehalococcoidia bacterium]